MPSLDELALELDDELGRVRNGLPSGHPLLLLDGKLQEMSGEENAALWHADALRSEVWDEVRSLALQALAAIDARPV